ncbi:MAG: dihydroneopterin aldolase [Lentisphaeraceae bacterium]|nr:dihydroneopterin aldolase [Lentisphaeraceae bacterium]
MNSDKIYLTNINVDILIGINPEERINKQSVVINAVLKTDCKKVAQSDDISDAVDYSIIHDQIVEHANSTHYDLIETLAENVAAICLQNKAVAECTVKVDKPEALEFAESVAIEITRGQN